MQKRIENLDVEVDLRARLLRRWLPQAACASLQHQRQIVKQKAQVAKMREIERATYEVKIFENLLVLLTSVHQECGEPCDWNAIHVAVPSLAPIRSDQGEREAISDAASYQPSFFDRLFRREARIRAEWAHKIEAAQQDDECEHQTALQEHIEEVADYKHCSELAARILKGESAAWLQAIEEYDPFEDVKELGSLIEITDSCTSGRKKWIEVTLRVNIDQVIPAEVKSLLKSGKLSIKKMPQGRFHDLSQDYVYGCVFRVARELFALLPAQTVIVHCTGALFDPKTGHTSEGCLLSAIVPASNAATLNWDALDPSGAMSNLTHRMNFKKLRASLQSHRYRRAIYHNSATNVLNREIAQPAAGAIRLVALFCYN